MTTRYADPPQRREQAPVEIDSTTDRLRREQAAREAEARAEAQAKLDQEREALDTTRAVLDREIEALLSANPEEFVIRFLQTVGE